MLETIVTTYIDKHRLLPPEGEIIVAVSGGADSLCLLHVLNRLCGSGKRYPEVRLHAAHLNHTLRGEASYQDEAGVASMVKSMGLPYTSGEVDVAELTRVERRSLEDAARVARYRFLREVAQGKLIAVAHHADDQVESLLLHFLRGSGLTGMVGMLPRHQDIIRPLLEVRHTQTVAYCREHGIEPLEDLSNADPRFLRNRIRHELVPLLESLNPGFDNTLLRNAGVIGVDVAWVEAQIDACWLTVVHSEKNNTIVLRREVFSSLPLSLQRHLLRRVTARLCEGQSPLEIRHYALIEQLLGYEDRQERELDLPHALRVMCNYHEIIVERLPAHTSTRDRSRWEQQNEDIALLPVPGQIRVPGTSWIAKADVLSPELMAEVRDALKREDWSTVWRLVPANQRVAYIDADVAGSTIEVRTWRAGDRMQPFGMQHEKKLQDIFVDRHIARSERASIPVFFSAAHCIWLAGICLDNRTRLTSRTQEIVRLAIIKEKL